MKVCVAAYACEPDAGSEPGVGWNWVRQIARFHEVWVLTRANNRTAIETALTQKPFSPRDQMHQMHPVHWIYFDLPVWLRFWKKGRRGIHLYYLLWQLGAACIAFRLHRRVEFNLLQHVTLSPCWFPSLFSFLSIPLVWGPVGGVEPLPRGLLPELSIRDALHESWQWLLKRAARLNPLLRLTAKRAAVIFAQTPATRDYLPRSAQKKTCILPAIGFSVNADCQRAANRQTHSGLHVLSVGRLIHIKGFALGLKAFAVLSHHMPDCTYTIIGDGPKKRALQQLAEHLGISEKVRFSGALPHAEVLETLRTTDVFLQPSFRDPPASSVMEAMAMGTPVVCLDSGGPAWQVTAETGIKVAVSTRERTVSGLAQALIDLGQNAARRSALGRAAQLRVREHFDWETKGQQVNEIYREIRRQIMNQKVCHAIQQTSARLGRTYVRTPTRS